MNTKRHAWPTLDGKRPEVIAHRGASGLRPEHTLEGYTLGLEQQADVIEPDLIACADGELYCRHDPTLARSTDVASRPEFAALRDGDDWPVWRFRSNDMQMLRAIQPFADRDHRNDGRFAIPRFVDALQWAAHAAASSGKAVVLYPEIKHPTLLAARGCDPLPRFVELARQLPDGVQLRLQCFELAPLRQLHDATGLPCTLLLEAGADWASMIEHHAGWLSALGVDKRLLYGASGSASALVEQAHDAGLRVDAWTFRDDQPNPRFDSIHDELQSAFALGVDGVFCDFPATAVAVRERIEAMLVSRA